MKSFLKQKIILISFFSIVIFLLPVFNVQAIEKKPLYQAILVKQNFSNIELDANKDVSFEVTFKNIGQATWYNNGANYLALNTTGPGERQSVFTHSSWPYFYQSTKMQEKKVKPGEIGTFKFILHSPNISESKKYIEKFRLVANNLTLVEGKGVIAISINVKGIPIKSEILPPQSNVKISLSSKIKLENKKQTIKIISNEGYKIKNQNDYLLINQMSGNETEIGFDNQTKKYFLNINGQNIINTDNYLKIYPKKNSEGILEITNYVDFSKSIENANNRFQGMLEIKYDLNTEQFLISNELPIEQKAAAFNPNELISDSDFTNYNSMTLAEIQNFLEINKSYLANYIVPSEEEVPFCYQGEKTSSIKIPQKNAGKKISEAIYLEAKEHQINPQVILTIIQKESSAINLNSMPNQFRHAWLLGYGYNDSMANCTYSFNQAKSQAELGGIGNQIAYASWWFQNNFNNGLGPDTYKVGDKIILSNANKEPMEVILSNRATACLYRYTPHVYNGNYNFWQNYQAWFVNNASKYYIALNP